MNKFFIRKEAGLFDFMKAKKEDKSPEAILDELDKKREDYAPVPGRRSRLFKIMQKQLDQTVKNTFIPAEAAALAKAYKASTGKDLKNPEKYIKPTLGVLLGYDTGLSPEIYEQLNRNSQIDIGGWTSHMKNVWPGLVDDGARYAEAMYGGR